MTPSKFIRLFLDEHDMGEASELTLVNPAEIEAMEI